MTTTRIQAGATKARQNLSEPKASTKAKAARSGLNPGSLNAARKSARFTLDAKPATRSAPATGKNQQKASRNDRQTKPSKIVTMKSMRNRLKDLAFDAKPAAKARQQTSGGIIRRSLVNERKTDPGLTGKVADQAFHADPGVSGRSPHRVIESGETSSDVFVSSASESDEESNASGNDLDNRAPKAALPAVDARSAKPQPSRADASSSRVESGEVENDIEYRKTSSKGAKSAGSRDVLIQTLGSLSGDANPGKQRASEFIDTVLAMIPQANQRDCFGEPKFAEAICRSAHAVQTNNIDAAERSTVFKFYFELDASSLLAKYATAGIAAVPTAKAQPFNTALTNRLAKKLAPHELAMFGANVGKIDELVETFKLTEGGAQSAANIAADLILHVIKNKAGYPGFAKPPKGCTIHTDVMVGICLAAIKYEAASGARNGKASKAQMAAVIRALQPSANPASAKAHANASQPKNFVDYYHNLYGALVPGNVSGKSPSAKPAAKPSAVQQPKPVVTAHTPAQAGVAGEVVTETDRIMASDDLKKCIEKVKSGQQFAKSFLRADAEAPKTWLKVFRAECHGFFGRAYQAFDSRTANTDLKQAVPPLAVHWNDASNDQKQQITLANARTIEIGKAIAKSLLDDPVQAFDAISGNAKGMFRDLISRLEANPNFRGLTEAEKNKTRRDSIMAVLITYGLNSGLTKHVPQTDVTAIRLTTRVGSYLKQVFGFTGTATAGASASSNADSSQDYIIQAMTDPETKALAANAVALIDMLCNDAARQDATGIDGNDS